MRPIYYVKHPDETFTEANPQPMAELQPAGWGIDTSTGTEILMFEGCSVIEGEQARLVLRLLNGHALYEIWEKQNRYREALEEIARSAPVGLSKIHPSCRLPNLAAEALADA